MIYGTVFDIKEFSVYDGPGIRCTVFLKGCPLRCKWCHNPEGLSAEPQVMLTVASCQNCGLCKTDCPATGSSDNFLNSKTTCCGCGECISKCPNAFRKLVGIRYTPQQLADEIMKNAFFMSDGGGVTFSGGEPTMQSEFLLETLRLLPLHKAIQTCGHCEVNAFKRILEQVDFLFFDIKHSNTRIHKQYTGVGNELILQNLEQVIKSKKTFVARIPLIKGVNDDRENLKNTALLLKNAPSLQRVEILPYNPAAGAKYSMVGKPYDQTFIAPETRDIDISVFENEGILCKIM